MCSDLLSLQVYSRMKPDLLRASQHKQWTNVANGKRKGGKTPMHLAYKNTKDEILAVMRQAKHEPPHLHHALELVWVKSGSLELGMGEELYHMQAGDVGILFPDLIHHYQVFSAGQNMAVFVNAPPFIVGAYEETLNQKAPKIPGAKSIGHPGRCVPFF